MELWQKVFREGLAPLLTTEQLTNLLRAVEENSWELGQGFTTSPPPLHVTADWTVQQACLVSYPGWKDGLTTVGEVEEFFARTCYEVDKRIGCPSGVVALIGWWDSTDRAEAFAALALEIEAELQGREPCPSAESTDPTL
jgi:hypothetical protein